MPIVWASGCRILARRPRRPRRDASPLGHRDAAAARERGTGERGRRRWRLGGTCRIAARRLTLTGGADRVGVRLPGDMGREWSRWRPVPAASRPAYAHRRGRSCERPDAGSQPAYAHRRGRSCGRPDAGFWPDVYVVRVATPVHLATGTRLPPVNTTRTTVGDLGGNGGTCRIATKRLRRDAGATGHNARPLATSG